MQIVLTAQPSLKFGAENGVEKKEDVCRVLVLNISKLGSYSQELNLNAQLLLIGKSMASQAYLRCFLRLTMNGISEDVLPQVELSRADYDRLTNYIALPPREKANFTFEGCPIFLWVETVDGVNLMVSEEDIDLLRLLTQRFPTPTPEPPRQLVEFDSDEDWEEDAAVYDETSTRGQVEIYFRGRSEPVVTSTLDGPDEIAQHFLLMDDPDALKMYLEADGEFIFFTDDDGEEVGVRPSQVVLIVAHPGSLDFGFMEDY